MEGIKEAIKQQFENRPYDGSHAPGVVTLRIWDGPGIDINGRVFQCRGYYKDKHIVYACLKDRYIALTKNKYHFTQSDLSNVERLLFGQNSDSYIKEVMNRSSNSSTSTTAGLSTALSVAGGIGTVIGTVINPEATVPAYRATKAKLIQLIAFYLKEVVVCSVDSLHGTGIDKLSTGGTVKPDLVEIKATISGSGLIDPVGVQFTPGPAFPQLAHRTVPFGGGEPISKYRSRSIYTYIDQGPLGQTQAKIRRNYNNINELYGIRCLFNEPNLAKDGDVWIEGIRSSVSNGIYETWVDDIGGGALLRASRRFVKHAASRYFWNIDPTEKRYATTRENPLSDMQHSNCITPVQTYIDDWFGDPNLYAGIINAILTLLSGFDTDDINVEYKKKFIDLGVFDYDKLQRRLEGSVV